MGVHLRRNRVRLAVSGPGFEIDVRWTERIVGQAWRADVRRNGEWVPDRTWDAVSRSHLQSRFAELHRLQAGSIPQG